MIIENSLLLEPRNKEKMFIKFYNATSRLHSVKFPINNKFIKTRINSILKQPIQNFIYHTPPKNHIFGDKEPIELDLPFPTITLEFSLNKRITFHKEEWFFTPVVIDCDSETRQYNNLIFILLVNEISPKNYEFIKFGCNLNEEFNINYINSDPKINLPEDYNNCCEITNYFLKQFSTWKHGIENINEKIKFRFNGKKFIKKVKYIHHVSPRILPNNPADPTGYTIDWDHRWMVRGHWRGFYLEDGVTINTTKIGKDRESNQNVIGYTWIKEHIKGGSNDKPLLIKPLHISKKCSEANPMIINKIRD